MQDWECGTCKFYVDSGTAGIGYCQRYPPTVFKMLSEIGSQGIEAHFPIVQSKFWCGEYIPKIDLSVN